MPCVDVHFKVGFAFIVEEMKSVIANLKNIEMPEIDCIFNKFKMSVTNKVRVPVIIFRILRRQRHPL